MKMSLSCTVAYVIAAFTIMQRIQIIASQLPISKAKNYSALFFDYEPETCKARLDRIEIKFEFQNREMIDLQQDYKAFKAKINNQQKSTAYQEDLNEKNGKMDSTSTLVATYGSSNHGVRVKKPVRLLPYSYLFKSNATKPVFNDPPTNCKDLGFMGHTLNGYYPVRLKLDTAENKIGMIYCKFDNPDTKASNIVEKKIGYMSIKSSPSVHFYVQRNKSFDQSNAIVRPFQIERLNVWGAMNLTSGLFKAPVNGIYFFSFQGFGQTPIISTQPFFVHLYVNNAKVMTSTANYPTGTPVILESTLKLRKGDCVFVKKTNAGTLLAAYRNEPVSTYFSGSLIEDDLIN